MLRMTSGRAGKYAEEGVQWMSILIGPVDRSTEICWSASASLDRSCSLLETMVEVQDCQSDIACYLWRRHRRPMRSPVICTYRSSEPILGASGDVASPAVGTSYSTFDGGLEWSVLRVLL